MKYLKKFNNVTEAVGVPTGILNITNQLYDLIIDKLSTNIKFSSKEGDPRKYKYKTREIELNFDVPLNGNINDYEVEKFNVTISITEVKRPDNDFEPEVSGAYYAPNIKLDKKNFKIIYGDTKNVNIGIRLEFPWAGKAGKDKEFWIKEIKKILSDNKSDVTSSLGHEIMHSYDLGHIKGGKRYEETADYSSSSNLHFGIPVIDQFFFYLYFMQKCELIVKSVEFAAKMDTEGITKDNFLEFLKNEKGWNVLRDINKWTYAGFHQDIIDNIDLVKQRLNKNNIPTEGMTPDEIANHIERIVLTNLANNKVSAIRDLLNSQEDITTAIRRLTGRYSDEDEEQEEAIEKYYNNIIDDIQKELNNPKKFYLKREKMFIFESEKLMRKISKLFSMAPDTKVNKLHTKISNKEIKTESILNWEKYQYAIGVNTKIEKDFNFEKDEIFKKNK